MRLEHAQLSKEVGKLWDRVTTLKTRKVKLNYDDLRPGGALGNIVGKFTFFSNFDCNDAFFDLINYTETCEPGKGQYENTACYHHVSV